MSAPLPEPATFAVSGNTIIQFLAGSLLLVTGALVAVIVYVFRDLAKKVEQLGNRIDDLAGSLTNRMDKLAERMDKLTERVDKLADSLHAEIAAVRQDVYHRLEQTHE